MSKTSSILAFSALEVARNFGLGFGFKPIPKISYRLNGWVGPRPLLEDDPNFMQPIPYVVVSDGSTGVPRFLTYSRGAQINEGRLRGKASVGLGGHVDAEHLVYFEDGSIDDNASIHKAAVRELEEEIGTVPGPLDTLGYIQVYDTDVDKVHLGVLMHCDATAFVQAGGKFVTEDGVENLQWLEKGQLTKSAGIELEVWSQVAIDQF